MGIREQMLMGIRRIIKLDVDIGVITRPIYEDNGRGSLVATGDTTSHNVLCRISYEGGGVWKNGEWEGGFKTDTTPIVLATHKTDIREGDTLEWRGKKYLVNKPTFPEIDGGKVCLQAALSEIV